VPSQTQTSSLILDGKAGSYPKGERKRDHPFNKVEDLNKDEDKDEDEDEDDVLVVTSHCDYDRESPCGKHTWVLALSLYCLVVSQLGTTGHNLKFSLWRGKFCDVPCTKRYI
jgi:hypothetical protein